MPFRLPLGKSVTRRRVTVAVAALLLLSTLLNLVYLNGGYRTVQKYLQHTPSPPPPPPPASTATQASGSDDGRFRWQDVPIHFPVASPSPLPTYKATSIPRIQRRFSGESAAARTLRLERLAAVKEVFQHAWSGYKRHAWMADEVGPLSGERHNFFGGWAASLVDALDTLWIMDMKDDFAEAVAAIEGIDFTTSEEPLLNVFETTIRYMGGFLGAYDLSDGQYPLLLSKAMELGEMLLVAFDTPNRMPVTRWQWQRAQNGEAQEAGSNSLSAEIGSLTLEFTRLSQITGDMRYYDAVHRIMDQFSLQQNKTRIPGMWPVIVNARDLDFGSDSGYTLGAMADSLYEYLPKQHILLAGRTDLYRNMYSDAAETFMRTNFYRPMTPKNTDILFSAFARTNDDDGAPTLDQSMQHLVCFAGGMVGIGAKIFDRKDDLDTARRVVDGCIWAYESMPNGLMTEVSHHMACPTQRAEGCEWNETRWHEEIMYRESDEDRASTIPYNERLRLRIKNERLQPGYTAINDRRYILRPEAIESVFIWYRISGDTSYQDKAWTMFESVSTHTHTDIANAALDDVTIDPPSKADRMESFWMAETLKYFYLTFAEPELVSLDDYVFNTEAHPLKRPV